MNKGIRFLDTENVISDSSISIDKINIFIPDYYPNKDIVQQLIDANDEILFNVISSPLIQHNKLINKKSSIILNIVSTLYNDNLNIYTAFITKININKRKEYVSILNNYLNDNIIDKEIWNYINNYSKIYIFGSIIHRNRSKGHTKKFILMKNIY